MTIVFKPLPPAWSLNVTKAARAAMQPKRKRHGDRAQTLLPINSNANDKKGRSMTGPLT
jgi:hypothetical protein